MDVPSRVYYYLLPFIYVIVRYGSSVVRFIHREATTDYQKSTLDEDKDHYLAHAMLAPLKRRDFPSTPGEFSREMVLGPDETETFLSDTDRKLTRLLPQELPFNIIMD